MNGERERLAPTMPMNGIGLLRVAGACAGLYAAGLVVVIGVLGGTGLLEASKATDVLPLMVEHRTTALIGLWLFVVLPVWLAVAGLGCLAALRSAGYVAWVAALAFIGGSFLALLRNILLLAMTYELAPAYANAGLGDQATLAALGDTLLSYGYIMGDLLGGVLAGGIGVPLFSAAMLRATLVPHWVAWLGFSVAITGGWGTLLLPLGGVFAIMAVIGVPLFIVWMVALAIALWRVTQPEIT